MAVIRCQACGKPNPDFLDVCQYCEARLKPMGSLAPLPGAADETLVGRPATPPADAPTTGSLMNRLRAMGADAEPDEPPAEAASGDAETTAVGDWLTRLRGVQGPGTATLPADRDAANEPDSMWGGQAAETPPAPPAAAGPSEPDLPEWLQDPSTPPLPEAGETTAKPRRKMTDWLNALGGQGAEPPPEIDEVPDWLKGLTSAPPPSASAAPPAPPPPAAPRMDDDTPDWLKTLRKGSTTELAGPPARPPQALPAWMRHEDEPAHAPAPSALEPPAPAAPEPPAPEPEAPLWSEPVRAPSLSQRMDAKPAWLRAEEQAAAETPAAPEPPAPEPPPAVPPAAEATVPSLAAAPLPPADDMPAWLREIITPAEAAAAAEVAAPPPEPPKKKKMTDWLGSAPAPSDEAPEPELLPDWLQTLSAAQAAPAGAAAPTPDSDLPEWLRTVSGDAAAPAPSAPAPAEPEPVAAVAPAAEPAEDLPDWLAAIAPAEAAADEPEPVEPAAAVAPAEDLPDWLAAIAPAEAAADEPEPVEPVAAVTPAAEPAEDLPDWLAAIAPAGAAAAEPAEDLPDWLAAITPAGAAAPAEPAPAGRPALDEDTAAWLSEFSGAAEAQAEPVAQAAPEAPEPLDLGQAAPVEMPAWMAEFAAASQAETPAAPLEAAGAAQAQAAGETAAIQPTPEGELPDWLRALRGVPAEAPAEEETPQWLRALRGLPEAAPEAGPEGVSPGAEQPAAPAGEPLATPATLPAWLAAMRPIDIEQAASPEADTYQETMGVLSGMRGVLRAESVVAQMHTAATAPRLELTDAHRANVRLLAELAPAEAAATLHAAPRPRLGALVERWVVFGLLALAIIAAQFQLPGLFGPPARITADTFHAYEAVAGLAARSGAPGTPPLPVLLALDYEAGQQGELNPGVQAIFTQALRQGNPVVLVSTKPEGAAVAQALLAATGAAYGQQVVNLGYLPGGPVGLLQFASAPRSSFTGDFSGALPDVWAAPALRGVEQLDDFGLVVVAASSAQALRGWIEQTEFVAPAVPLVAVVSAGAEPMTRPYLTGAEPQLAGMVAGVAGAAQYERQAGQSGAATALWPALGGGLWMAVALIAVGNVVFGLLALVRRRRR